MDGYVKGVIMGKRSRERIQAIIEGKILSIRDKRDVLCHEVIKLAAVKLFNEGEQFGKHTSNNQTFERVGEIIAEVMPQAMVTTGIKCFSIPDITRKNDINEHMRHVIVAICAKMEQIRFMDRKGHLYKLRKDKSGRKRTGNWYFCDFCGEPFYRNPASTQRWHTFNCYINGLKHTKQINLVKTEISQ